MTFHINDPRAACSGVCLLSVFFACAMDTLVKQPVLKLLSILPVVFVLCMSALSQAASGDSRLENCALALMCLTLGAQALTAMSALFRFELICGLQSI